MSSIAAAGLPARAHPDRNVFLFFTSMVWAGVLSGFGTDSYRHVRRFGLDYPLIVHLHAVAFVGWLILFTVQVLLIRSARTDLHRKLGLAAVWLLVAMVILGPSTALVVDAHSYASTGRTPEFLAVQFTDILALATLAGAGLLLRRNSPAHKRLLLLALFYISDAGFARFLNPIFAAPLGQTFWGEMVYLYMGSDVLMLGLGAYDLATRRKLYPAYFVGLSWALFLQLAAYTLLTNPAWKDVAMHLIGH